jgi:hypothetical protein
MSNDVRLVTVHGAGQRVDLTVPASVPVVDLVPTLADLCRAGQDASVSTPPVWGLARVGARPFELSASLEQAGVMDGEVLCLVDIAVWRAPVVRAAADVVADTVRTTPRWDARATAALLAGIAGAQLVAATAIGAAAAPGGLPAALAAGVAAAALLALASVAGRAGHGSTTTLALLAGGVAVAGLATWLLVGGGRDAFGLAAAALGVTLAVLAAYPMAPAVAPGAAVAGGSLAAGAAAVALGAGPVRSAAVVAVVAVVALRLLPRLVGRDQAGAEAGSQAGGEESLQAAARRTHLLLASLSAGTALAAVGAVAVLAVLGDTVAGALAAAAAIALLLQVPTYRFLPHALPLALAAGVAFLAIELAVAVRLLLLAGQGPGAVALLAAGGAATAGASAAHWPGEAGARWAARAWPVVDAALVLLALAELGVLNGLSRLVHGLVG